jgi:hypothetical protein
MNTDKRTAWHLAQFILRFSGEHYGVDEDEIDCLVELHYFFGKRVVQRGEVPTLRLGRVCHLGWFVSVCLLSVFECYLSGNVSLVIVVARKNPKVVLVLQARMGEHAFESFLETGVFGAGDPLGVKVVAQDKRVSGIHRAGQPSHRFGNPALS